MNSIFIFSTLVLTGGQVILSLLAIAGAISLVVYSSKQYLKNKSEEIKGEHCSDSLSPTLRKYDEVNIEQHQRAIKLVGTSSAVAIVLVVFAWTQLTSERVVESFSGILDIETLVEPPTTSHTVALPPPPKVLETQTVEVVVEEVIPEPEEEEKVEQEETSPVNTDMEYTGPTDENSDGFPTGIVIEKVTEEEPEDDDTVIDVPDQMPRFPGCEDVDGDMTAKKACADQKLLAYIYDKIKYPVIAQEMGIEGMVLISFVVNKDGSINDIEIIKDPGGGCGKEAARVVKTMKKIDKWTPGKFRGRERDVRFRLPVRFRLK